MRIHDDDPSRRARAILFTLVNLVTCCLLVPATVVAQSWRAFDLDPSLSISAMNNVLVAVGTSDSGVPFLRDANGVRQFPEFRQRMERLRINDHGVVTGRYGHHRVFRANLRTGEFAVVEFAPDRVALVQGLSETGIVIIWTQSFLPYAPDSRQFLWDGAHLVDVETEYGIGPSHGVYTVASDGTVGGGDVISGRPFLKQRGQPIVYVDRPAVPAQMMPFPCDSFSLRSWNDAGYALGQCHDVRVNRWVPYAFVGGEWVNLANHFNRPGEYLAGAAAITDDGVVTAVASTVGGRLRPVILMPSTAEVPDGVNGFVSGRTVAISWNAKRVALEYIVEAGSAPGLSDFFSGSVGSQLSISGTVPPGRYFVRVRARTTFGISPPSIEIEFNVP